MKTRQLTNSSEDISHAAALLNAGEVVAFPTETVYGLGADATNDLAVAKIYEAKSRPSFNPLIVHVTSLGMAQALVHWNATAQMLADAFWPGALTMVLPVRNGAGVSKLVTAGLETLAVRLPAHSLARGLIAEADVPLAAPSANPSGSISPVSAAHVLAGLDGRIAAVLDGGHCNVGLESTILGLSDAPVLLRPGGVSSEAIEDVMGASLATRQENAAISAPGQLTSHYAPEQSVTLNCVAPREGTFLIGFGEIQGDISLSDSGDLVEAAAHLFSALHTANATGLPIAVAPVPHHGLGVAINDRLNRAAAPR